MCCCCCCVKCQQLVRIADDTVVYISMHLSGSSSHHCGRATNDFYLSPRKMLFVFHLNVSFRLQQPTYCCKLRILRTIHIDEMMISANQTTLHHFYVEWFFMAFFFDSRDRKCWKKRAFFVLQNKYAKRKCASIARCWGQKTSDCRNIPQSGWDKKKEKQIDIVRTKSVKCNVEFYSQTELLVRTFIYVFAQHFYVRIACTCS